MKKLLITILFVFTFFLGFSQKIKLRNGEVLVDNVVWMKYLDCGFTSKGCSLLNFNGEEIVFIQKMSLSSNVISYYGISESYESYNEVKFLGTKMYFEIKGSFRDILQMLYAAKVIDTEGKLDKERASRLVEKYGTSVTDAAENNNKYNTPSYILAPPVIVRPNYYPYPHYRPSIDIYID